MWVSYLISCPTDSVLYLEYFLMTESHSLAICSVCETMIGPIKYNWVSDLYFINQCDLVLLDFCKAFDKVNHLKLLFKLSTHGIKGKSLKWISSFLGGRTQAVVLEGECSPSGVP